MNIVFSANKLEHTQLNANKGKIAVNARDILNKLASYAGEGLKGAALGTIWGGLSSATGNALLSMTGNGHSYIDVVFKAGITGNAALATVEAVAFKALQDNGYFSNRSQNISLLTPTLFLLAHALVGMLAGYEFFKQTIGLEAPLANSVGAAGVGASTILAAAILLHVYKKYTDSSYWPIADNSTSEKSRSRCCPV